MTEIVEKSSGKPIPHPKEKRYEVAKALIATGNQRIAAEMTGISYDMIGHWKKQPWWPELYEEVKREHREVVQSKIGQLAVASLEIIEDRLQNGEYVLNNKTGEIIKKPVSIRDANQVMNNLLTQHTKLEELNHKETVVNETVSDVLNQLAKEFAKFNSKQKNKDVIDVEAKEI